MQRLGLDNKFIRNLTSKAKISPKSSFAEADHYKILKAAEMALEEELQFQFYLERNTIFKK